MKVIIVGDMHVVPDEIKDSEAVLNLVLETAKERGIENVWFTGDQHHTHSVIRVEVMNWWRQAFAKLSEAKIGSTALVGNHDQHNPGSPVHAMMAYSDMDDVYIVDKPEHFGNGVLMVPYVHTEQEFIDACNEFRGYTKTVFCHQTFNGAKYENGFYAKDGFEASKIPQVNVISGHIHSGMEFDKVWYVGSPRWRTLGDANQERFIWVVEFSEDGDILSREGISTGGVCKRFYHMVDTPDNLVDISVIQKPHRYQVDVKGPADFCHARKAALKAAGARVRTFPEHVSTKSVKESDGIDVAFGKFLDVFVARNGTDSNVLRQMAKERLS